MARGQEVRWTFTWDSRGLVSAAATGTASMDRLGTAQMRTTAAGAKLTQTMGGVATIMARTASSMGLPTEALRAIDIAADAATLGLKNLTRSAVGFNAASAGVVGIGLTVAAAIVTISKKLGDANDGMGMLGLSTRGLDKDMRKLWDTMMGGPATGPAIAGWANTVRDAFDQVQAKVQIARLELAKGLSAAGLKSGQIEDVLAGKQAPTAAEQFLASLKKQEEATKKAAEAAERWKEAWVNAAEAARKANDAFNRSLAEGTAESARSLQAAMISGSTARMDAGIPETLIAPMRRGRDLSGLMSGVASGSINAGVRAEDIKDAAAAGVDFSRMLGDVAHAFQLLGIGADSVLGRFVGSLTVVGASIDSILKGRKQGGAAGLLGQITGYAGIAAAGFSLIKGLFGGPSKEERAAAEEELKRKEEERKREEQRIRSAAVEMRGRGIEGLATVGPQFFMGRTITDADGAQRQGTLFAAAWGTVVKEKGIVFAANAFKDAFTKMKADIEAAGIEAPEWMKLVSGQMELGLNEEFAALAESARIAAQFLLAFAEAGGVLNKETLAAFEQEARAAFAGGKDVALGLGKGEEEAVKAGFAAANPLLRGLLDQSIVQGVALSADIQAMIDAAGIVPSELVQSLEELRGIRKAVEALAGMGSVPGGNGKGDPPDWVHDIPQYQKGGRIDERERRGGGGSLAILHPGETVVPDEDAASFAESVLGGDSGSGSVSMALASLAAEVRASRDRPRDLTINVPAPDLRGAIIPRGGEDVIVERVAREFARQITQGGPILSAILRAADGRFVKK